jgi:hypothetical protein
LLLAKVPRGGKLEVLGGKEIGGGRELVGRGAEGVVAVQNHRLGMVMHDGECRDVKVSEHGVRLPAADELNEVLVDSGNQKGNGATRAERLGSDMVRYEAKGGAGSNHDALNEVGNVT